MNLKKLKEPFASGDVEWRIQRSGVKNNKVWAMCLAYITSRAVMDRLDDVAGAENWRNEFKEGPHGGVLCGISIKLSDEWVTKWDGADNTDIEAVKGGLSGAMKRAAVLWGIGRYLYNLDAGFAIVSDSGKFRAQTKDKKSFKWSPPALPVWALPAGSESSNGRTPETERNSGNGGSTPPSETKKKLTSEDIKYFNAMTEQKKKLGEEMYYSILKSRGLEHCNELTSRETRKALYKAVSEA